MTCTLDAANEDEDDDVVLSWLDGTGQEVTSVTGRYEVNSSLVFGLVHHSLRETLLPSAISCLHFLLQVLF